MLATLFVDRSFALPPHSVPTTPVTITHHNATNSAQSHWLHHFDHSIRQSPSQSTSNPILSRQSSPSPTATIITCIFNSVTPHLLQPLATPNHLFTAFVFYHLDLPPIDLEYNWLPSFTTLKILALIQILVLKWNYFLRYEEVSKFCKRISWIESKICTMPLFI